jgi:hypothetical protein
LTAILSPIAVYAQDSYLFASVNGDTQNFGGARIRLQLAAYFWVHRRSGRRLLEEKPCYETPLGILLHAVAIPGNSKQ